MAIDVNDDGAIGDRDAETSFVAAPQRRHLFDAMMKGRDDDRLDVRDGLHLAGSRAITAAIPPQGANGVS